MQSHLWDSRKTPVTDLCFSDGMSLFPYTREALSDRRYKSATRVRSPFESNTVRHRLTLGGVFQTVFRRKNPPRRMKQKRARNELESTP